MQLTEKYQPRKIQDFVGLEKVKQALVPFAANPYGSAWLFSGPTGVGKTSMALALASEISKPEEEDARIQEFINTRNVYLVRTHSNKCNVDYVKRVGEELELRVPMYGKWWFFIVDEAEEMTRAAQLEFLSVLQPIRRCAIFVFTCNPPAEVKKANGKVETVDKLEKRFRDRCNKLEFSSHGLRQDIARHLAYVWSQEAPQAPLPNFEQIAKDSQNSVRDALRSLELRLLTLGTR